MRRATATTFSIDFYYQLYDTLNAATLPQAKLKKT